MTLIISVYLNRWVASHFRVAGTPLGSSKPHIILLNGSSNCISFCFVEGLRPNVENHWFISIKNSLSQMAMQDNILIWWWLFLSNLTTNHITIFCDIILTSSSEIFAWRSYEGVIHKWCHGTGGGGQWFCDDVTKSLV